MSFLFLSTPSARRATVDRHGPGPRLVISIHALREEGDRADCRRPIPSTYFYPRPPRGGRRRNLRQSDGGQRISIHALREEGDLGNTAALSVTTIFLSTPSARRATRNGVETVAIISVFLSTPSARRATAVASRLFESQQFLSTPSARRATTSGMGVSKTRKQFLSTPSARRATWATQRR